MSLIILDICLSDIPPEAMKQSQKNGKWYTKICCADRREKDQFDNTHTLYLSQTEEERRANTNKHYVGSGKMVATGGQPQPQNGYPAAPTKPQQPGSYPPAQPGGYPAQPSAYPAQTGAYPPQQPGSYPPAQTSGYPQQPPQNPGVASAPATPGRPGGMPF